MRLWKTTLLAATLLACRERPSDSVQDAGNLGAATHDRKKPNDERHTETAANGTGVLVDFLALDDACEVGHRGTLLDFGDATTSRLSVDGKKPLPSANVELTGATWLSVQGNRVATTFLAPPTIAQEGTLAVEAATAVNLRINGGAAKAVSAYVNGRAIGTAKLTRGQTQVVHMQFPGLLVQPGENELLLRFHVPPKTTDVAALLDWAHVGPVDGPAPLAASTRSDVVVTARIGNVPKRAVSLRAPSFARCTTFLPPGARVEGFLGLQGDGEADVEVRVARDRSPETTVESYHLTSKDSSQWRSFSAALPDVGTLGSVELLVTHASKGLRVAFGEPRIVAKEEPREATPVPRARGAVIVVLSHTSARSLPYYGATEPFLPELAALADHAIVFVQHRASSTLAAANVASLVTGASPKVHGVTDPLVRLPGGLTTVAEAARQGGADVAFFTANPTTSAAFGFDRGWETFAYDNPMEPVAGYHPFDAAAEWIGKHKDAKFLVVVHARGGHPPWDVTTDQMKEMVPKDYAGGLDPRHAGELLAKARAIPPLLKFSDADRERVWGMHQASLRNQDAAIGRLRNALRSTNREEDTLFVVTSDVGAGEGALVPFGEGGDLDEASLTVPLLLRVPKGAQEPAATLHTKSPSADVDLPRTVLNALGLDAPSTFEGVDLYALAHGDIPREGRQRMAVVGRRYSLRWGNLLLQGNFGDAPKLCDLSLEAVCVSDVKSAYPIAYSRALAELSGRILAPTGPTRPRELTALDMATQGALKLWGL